MTEQRPGASADTAGIRSQKRALRSQILASRDENDLTQDAARQARVIELIDRSQPKVVACYLHVPPEPATNIIVEACHERGLTVVAPLLRGAQPRWAVVTPETRLAPGWAGIPTPLDADEFTGVADFVGCSALAATASGVRLGVGGGWFDRVFHAWPEAVRCGLVNEAEVLGRLPVEEHDLALDYVVTEARSIATGARELRGA